MKTKLNLISLFPLMSLIAISGCNNNGSSGEATNLNSSTADKTKSGVYLTKNGEKVLSGGLKAIVEPLTISIDTSQTASSMITVTNPNQVTQMITSDPIISNSAFIFNKDSAFYPKNATICLNNTTLAAGQSCQMLVVTDTQNTTTQLGQLKLVTATYSYIVALTKAQLLYIGGSFSAASNRDNNFESEAIKVSSQNQGTCGPSGESACMLISYNTYSGKITEISEANDEIYALQSMPHSDDLLAAGAFNQMATSESTIKLPNNILNANKDSALIAHIKPNKNLNIYGHANQLIYTIALSNPRTGQWKFYFAGAFSAIASGTKTSYDVNGYGKCTTAKNWYQDFQPALYGNGSVKSLISTTDNRGSSNDYLIVAGKFNTQQNQTIPNGNVGLTACLNGDCSVESPVVLNGMSNAIAATPDNRILISGDFSSINGAVKGNTPNNVLASGNLQTLGQYSVVSTGNAKVKALLATDDNYFMGGDFSQMNKVPEIITKNNGICGPNLAGSLCVLSQFNNSYKNTSSLLFTDGPINAIASGVQLNAVYTP